MAWKWLNVLALVLLAFAGAHTEERTSDVPLFVETFNRLHREPPMGPAKTRAKVDTLSIEQKLDHFDENETRTWQMRYMVNNEHFQEGGPIFIYVGGEWTISAGRISSGHFVDLAKEHNGILFYTEHRFYGESKPTNNIAVDNLNYLHVKQALADLAYFIEYQKANNLSLANSKVIISGCSYSATMVVWFKRLYPNIVAGGWASSAPIFAKPDFVEYKEVIGKAMIELGSQACYNRIENGIATLETMFESKRGAEVKAMLKICNNFDEYNDLDLWSLFGALSNMFSAIVQYQSGDDITAVCDYLMSFDDDMKAIVNFFFVQYGHPSTCYDMTYKRTLTYYIDSTYAQGASRPWYYQTCNEYGWYQTSGSTKQPFGTKFPLLLYTTLCEDIFGDEYTNAKILARTEQTNVDFGGFSPEVENIHMTHGGLDPWSAMGQKANDGATVIPYASHCADLSSIHDSDSAEMRASKELLAQLVNQWLADDSLKIRQNTTDNPSVKARKFMRQLLTKQ